MSFHRSKWIPELKEQSNGGLYASTYDGCGDVMQSHYAVNSVLYSPPTWGFNSVGVWVQKEPRLPGNHLEHNRNRDASKNQPVVLGEAPLARSLVHANSMVLKS